MVLSVINGMLLQSVLDAVVGVDCCLMMNMVHMQGCSNESGGRMLLNLLMFLLVLWIDILLIGKGMEGMSSSSNVGVFVGIALIVVPLYLTIMWIGATTNRWWCDKLSREMGFVDNNKKKENG